MGGARMGSMLVHIDPSAGPVGVWAVDGDQLRHAYLPDADVARNRAWLLLHDRGSAVPWADWFTQLADRPPYIDDYTVIDTAHTDPADLLAQLRAIR